MATAGVGRLYKLLALTPRASPRISGLTSTKRIREENLPLNVSKMFEIARVVSSSKERWLPPPNEHNTIKLTREDLLAVLKELYKEQV